jgi:hypothetical protein
MPEPTKENAVTATDLLREQHERVKTMLAAFDRTQGQARLEAFDALADTLAAHEAAEKATVHPEAMATGDTGAQVVAARLAEEAEAEKALNELRALGADSPGFPARFAAFSADVLRHAAAEEGELFPLLEANVARERLVELAGEIRAAEAAHSRS